MRRLICVVGLVLMTVLAGCGRGGSPPPAPSRPPVEPLPTYSSVADMSKAAGAQETPGQTVRVLINGVANGEPDPTFNGVGAVRFDAAGPTVEFSEQAQRLNGSLADVALVVQPTDAFLKPPVDITLPPRKSWQRITPATTAPFYQQFVPVVAALRTYLDPVGLFARYGNSISVAAAVADRVGGTQAMRYDLHIDPGTVPARLPASAIQMWLDAHDHVVRVVVDQPTPHLTLDAEFQGWGSAVTIAVPDPTQVAQ